MGIGNYLIEAYFYIYFYINEFQRELTRVYSMQVSVSQGDGTNMLLL